MKTGLIFDVQSFSTHDGPGCRTSVFFSGCPLRCKWCANPESWVLRPHMMFTEGTCKWKDGCRLCVSRCPYGAIREDENGAMQLDRARCQSCKSYACRDICPSGCFKQPVREYTVEELMKILRRDMQNWGRVGGVTFSGGEPCLQYDFLCEVLRQCRSLYIHTAIETSAHVPEEVFLSVMKGIDFAFVDIKNMDDQKHIEGTGVSNKLTLSNIRALRRSGWPGRLVLRTPIIGGYNDSDENALRAIEFMNETGCAEINLLQFHRMGVSKWTQLGMEYAYAEKGHGDVSDERLEHLQQLYLKNNIVCYLKNDTYFG